MQDNLGILRHSIRGTINAMKLGATVMDDRLAPNEAIEFLDYIIDGSEKMGLLLDQYEAYPEEQIVRSLKAASRPVA